jgi:hypothetical protein
LLTESFQRDLIIVNFKKWLSSNIKGFFTIQNITKPIQKPVEKKQPKEIKNE